MFKSLDADGFHPAADAHALKVLQILKGKRADIGDPIADLYGGDPAAVFIPRLFLIQHRARARHAEDPILQRPPQPRILAAGAAGLGVMGKAGIQLTEGKDIMPVYKNLFVRGGSGIGIYRRHARHAQRIAVAGLIRAGAVGDIAVGAVNVQLLQLIAGPEGAIADRADPAADARLFQRFVVIERIIADLFDTVRYADRGQLAGVKRLFPDRRDPIAEYDLAQRYVIERLLADHAKLRRQRRPFEPAELECAFADAFQAGPELNGEFEGARLPSPFFAVVNVKASLGYAFERAFPDRPHVASDLHAEYRIASIEGKRADARHTFSDHDAVEIIRVRHPRPFLIQHFPLARDGQHVVGDLPVQAAARAAFAEHLRLMYPAGFILIAVERCRFLMIGIHGGRLFFHGKVVCAACAFIGRLLRLRRAGRQFCALFRSGIPLRGRLPRRGAAARGRTGKHTEADEYDHENSDDSFHFVLPHSEVIHAATRRDQLYPYISAMRVYHIAYNLSTFRFRNRPGKIGSRPAPDHSAHPHRYGTAAAGGILTICNDFAEGT